MKNIVRLILVLYIFFGSNVMAGEDIHVYRKAMKAVSANQPDFAYMHFRAIVRDNVQSRHLDEALFATGEYYFQIPDYSEAVAMFKRYSEEFPDSEGKLFALAYLFRIAQINEKQELITKFKKDIVDLEQVSLVFRDFEEYLYISPMQKTYRAVFQIDNIEFYVEGELFAKITY